MLVSYPKEKIRAAILHNIFAPYREGLFREISNLPGIELRVYYCSGKSPGRKWKIKPSGYNYKVLRGITLGKSFHINIGIITRLIKDSPDVLVVGGYSYPTAVIAIFVAKLLKIPLILWSATSLLEKEYKPRKIKERIKFKTKKFLIGLSSKYLVPGKRARKYIQQFGAPSNKIFIMRNSFDFNFFKKNSNLSSDQIKDIKDKLNIQEKELIIYTGRLKKEKGLKVLLKAYKEIKPLNKKIGLLVIGNGPQKKELEMFCSKNKLKGAYFLGFKQKKDLPKLYGISNLFVLPSYKDTWGMVVNEAMACGLPVITTDKVGASYDLICSDKNGLVVKAGDVDALKEAILKIFKKTEQEIEKMGRMSQEIISEYTHKKSAYQFLKAIKTL